MFNANQKSQVKYLINWFRSTGFILIFLLGLKTDSLAQPPCPSKNCPPPIGTPVPISGIEILIGLGGIYGASRMINNKKKKSNPVS